MSGGSSPPRAVLFRPLTEGWSRGGAPSVVGGAPSVVGDLRLHRFTSRIFANARIVRVLLPPGYDHPANADRRYPVLYLNDGQNLFDRATSFAGTEWQVDETVARLVGQGAISPLIVVGIDHARRRRTSEYVPFASLHPRVRRPRGRRYPAFLVDELMPHVNRTYRTRVGPANAGLGGSSLGAAIALYTALARPGVFGRLLLESPSLFLAGGRLLEESAACAAWPRRVYLAIGAREAAHEEGSARLVANVCELERLLHAAGLRGDRLRVVVEEGGTHDEASWARRLPGALTFLFGTRTAAGAAHGSGA